jgi:transcriptional regulator with XRE-family HTH domain
MSPNYNEFIASRIKELRIKKAISQKVVSKYISLSPNAYSRIENGYTQITIENLFLIAECLNIQIEEILDLKETTFNKKGTNFGSQNNEITLNISLSHKEIHEIYNLMEKQKNID